MFKISSMTYLTQCCPSVSIEFHRKSVHHSPSFATFESGLCGFPSHLSGRYRALLFSLLTAIPLLQKHVHPLPTYLFILSRTKDELFFCWYKLYLEGIFYLIFSDPSPQHKRVDLVFRIGTSFFDTSSCDKSYLPAVAASPFPVCRSKIAVRSGFESTAIIQARPYLFISGLALLNACSLIVQNRYSSFIILTHTNN